MKLVPLFVDHLADGIDGDADGESAVAVDAVTAIFVGSEQLTYLDLLRRV